MTVHLVGAGPGDPELLTLRAVRLLQSCDVVIHDRLVSDEILSMIPTSTELVNVGKHPGGTLWSQADINSEIIRQGSLHNLVVRLKGGDPYLFGRGGEEALALTGAGLDVEVVPGISSALAAPTAGGVPVTHRSLSTAVTIVTASTASDTSGIDWDALGSVQHTLVFLMGVRLAPTITAELLARGRSPSTPIAVIGSATTPRQQSVRTTLDQLPAVGIPAPATIVIGDVTGFEGLPHWKCSDTDLHDDHILYDQRSNAT